MTLRSTMRARLALWLGALSLLGGCVAFEHPPVSKLRCDPLLAGQWRSLGDGPSNRPIMVSADCTLQWPDDDGSTYTTRLRAFTLGDQRYLVFSPDEADRLMSADGDLRRRAPKDSVFMARYRIDDDHLRVWLADADEALRPLPKTPVVARRIDDTLVYVEGDRRAIAKLLRTRGDLLFAGGGNGTGMLKLQRMSPTEAAP